MVDSEQSGGELGVGCAAGREQKEAKRAVVGGVAVVMADWAL